jgi:hypothetical protein
MRCNICGNDSPDAEVDYRSVAAPDRPRVRHTATKFESYHICRACAEYRRGTNRLVYWIAAAVALFVLLALLIDLFV